MMDYENILSRKVQDLQFSGIRKFFDIAASYDDVISLSVGEPDFKTPWAIRKEAIRVLEKGRTNYTANAGLADLRVFKGNFESFVKETIRIDKVLEQK